jgi:putative chitinase
MALTLTAEQLARIAGRATPLMPHLAEWMNRLCPEYEIDSPQEFSHFLAQACHETDHFRTLREYASGKAYEGRADLGNKQPGDGVRFKGRGIFQTTGRANYLQLGVRKGQRDLFVNNPQLLEQAEYAVWSACEYWRTRGLNDIANQPDGAVLKKKVRGELRDSSPVEYISITINGGVNGLAERKKFYAIASRVLAEAAPAAPAAPRAARGAPPAAAKKPRRKPAATKPATRKAAATKLAPKKAAAKKAPRRAATPARNKAPASAPTKTSKRVARAASAKASARKARPA